MGFFADPNGIQAQMAARAEKRRAAQAAGANKGVDWKVFNAERKEKKRKATIKALLADDDE